MRIQTYASRADIKTAAFNQLVLYEHISHNRLG